jgi:hypothetical protein
MKKIIYLLSFTFLILQSCSSSDGDNNSSDSNFTLLRKSITTDPDGVYTSTYTYNGNKISSVNTTYDYNNNNNTFSNTYITYSGDLISEMKTYDSNDVLVGKSTYNYNSNNQPYSKVDVSYPSNFGRKTIITYNSNGTITGSIYEGDIDNQNNLYTNYTLTISNGQIISSFVGNYNPSSVYYYTYDNKNCPGKNLNLTASEKLLCYNVYGGGSLYHNKIREEVGNYVSNREYTYNSYDYPTLESSVENPDITAQYFY